MTVMIAESMAGVENRFSKTGKSYCSLKTPGLEWRHRNGTTTAYWRSSKKAVKAGYPQRTQRLWSGTTEPDAGEIRRIEETCWRLQRETADWMIDPARKRPSKIHHAPGVVYFILSQGLIKIGFTTNLQGRLSDFQTYIPIGIELLGAIEGSADRERAVHAKFRHLHHRGEWFVDSREIRDFIDEALQ